MAALRCSISICPRRMEHQSLCSATGMPHSTQMRTRWTGAEVFDEKSRLRKDIPGLQATVTRRRPYATSRDGVTPVRLDRSRRKHWVRRADPAKRWYGGDDHGMREEKLLPDHGIVYRALAETYQIPREIRGFLKEISEEPGAARDNISAVSSGSFDVTGEITPGTASQEASAKLGADRTKRTTSATRVSCEN